MNRGESMTKLAEVQARFAAALDALDRAVAKSGRGVREDNKLNAEVSSLKAERESLFARITALEDETRVLAGLTEEVEDRLDTAIAEIRHVLAHN
jgi:cell division protein FtsB